MLRKKYNWLTVLLAFAVMLTLAACGGGVVATDDVVRCRSCRHRLPKRAADEAGDGLSPAVN